MAKKEKNPNQSYIDHHEVVLKATKILWENGISIYDNLLLARKQSKSFGRFVLKGTLLPQPDYIYVEYMNDKHIPILDREGELDKFVYYANNTVFLIDWIKFRKAVLFDTRLFQVVTSKSSQGYLVPINFVRMYGRELK